MAEEMGLVVAAKPDSQDICFVPQGKYYDIIAKLRPAAATPGDVVHIDGRTLGRHEGILHYTIGQRRGLGIASGEPLYVIHLDAECARVVVGPREALETHRIYLRDVNWLGDGALEDLPAEGIEIHAKVRSTRPPRPARLHQAGGAVWVDLAAGEAGVAPGQACAFYSDDGDESRVFGGGFIEKSERSREAEIMLARLRAPLEGNVA
jgi:tRNA-specific 2-thiouridylase